MGGVGAGTPNAERSDLDQAMNSNGHDGSMPAWPLLVAVFCISGRKGGEAGRGSDGTPEARDGGAGMPEQSFGLGQKPPWMPLGACKRIRARGSTRNAFNA